jgi:hypothetical protein
MKDLPKFSNFTNENVNTKTNKAMNEQALFDVSQEIMPKTLHSYFIKSCSRCYLRLVAMQKSLGK